MQTRASGRSPSVISLFAPRKKIHARDASGRHTTRRWLCVWLTQLVYYGLPWLSWNGRQAVLFDLAARRFSIFGLVLWPQDFIYLAGLLIICACLLFLLSALAGRVWCSYACPHTVYSEIFMWIERRIEGSRSARMRLDRQPLSFTKFGLKALKHLLWGAVALWTGITLVAYFTPMRTLLRDLAAFSPGPWQTFWLIFYSAFAYVNAGWMREQICKYLCAYARFQSVMFDRDTLVISYDGMRGEPRGARRWRAQVAQQGDCIDCTLCAQVCPTGIDIRDGFQFECIDCAACIDACDGVMDKIGAARGLIRYTSENAARHGFSARQVRRRMLRPRVLAYAGILGAATVLYASALATRTPLRLDVGLDRGTLARETDEGAIENVYHLQIMNMDERPHRYRLAVSGIDGIALAADDEVEVGSSASRVLPVRVRVPHGRGEPGVNRIRFELVASDNERVRTLENTVFHMPRR